MAIFAVRLFMAMLASSYVTMGVFAEEKAAELWWPYALAQFMLTIISIGADVIRKAKSDRTGPA